MAEDVKDPTDDQSQAPDPMEGVDIDDPIDEPTDEDGNIVEDDGDDQDPDPGEKGGDPKDKQTTINQEAVDKKIHKLTFEKYEEKRKREALESELKALKHKAADGADKVEIPPIPDRYDPDFEEKMEARDKAIMEQANANAAVQVDQQNRQQAEAQALQQNITKMYAGAEKLGIKESEMQEADNKVAMFVTDPALAKYILGREDSTQVVKYLADSIVELDELSKMEPTAAAAKIAAEIAPKASEAFKQKTPGAPNPLDIPGGRGAPEKKSKFLVGVEFE